MSILYDGDSSDLTTSDYFYPEFGGYQTGYGHTDFYGDMDFAPVYLWSSNYYDLRSTGTTESAIWDNTSGNWLYGDSYQSNVYINATHANYLFVRGYATGESYSATIAPRYVTDGDSSDMTTENYLYPNYSGYQSGYGHTDFYGDLDYANLYMHTSGYYNVTSTGNTAAYVYDIAAGSLVYGSTYQSNLYLCSGHNYYIGVYGFTHGERYSVTVTQNTSSFDGDSSDLTLSKTIYPSIAGYQTATGHTDFYLDQDYCNLGLSSSGYYDVTTTGSNIYAFVYDKTTYSDVRSTTATNNWGAASYTDNIYLDSSHTYNIRIVGYTTGVEYSATLKSHI